MFDFFLTSFLALVAVVNPLIVLPPFLGLVGNASEAVIFRTARKAALVAGGILLSFVLLGHHLLGALGISQGALVIAGGILLFYTAFHMVTGNEEDSSDQKKVKSPHDVAVFPLGFPIITGPAAISIVMAKLSEVGTGFVYQITMAAAIFLVCVSVFVTFMFGKSILRPLGKSGINIMQRLIGLALSALACQMVVSGCERCFSDYTAKHSSVS